MARPVSAWRYLPATELEEWLLDRPNVADAAWTALTRDAHEDRPAFVARAVEALGDDRPVRPARGLALASGPLARDENEN